MGAIVSALGILASFQLDLATGATIVCTFGVALLLIALIWAAKRPSLAPRQHRVNRIEQVRRPERFL
jgi:hypothetical protein